MIYIFIYRSGFQKANDKKLENYGIDVNHFQNRVMRNSVEDDRKLEDSGIEVKQMLKSGIDPATFLAGGVGAIPDDKLKKLGVDKNKLGDEDLKKLGLNKNKLQSKGIYE